MYDTTKWVKYKKLYNAKVKSCKVCRHAYEMKNYNNEFIKIKFI